MERSFESFRYEAEEIEFPNLAEGFNAVYEVSDGEVRLKHEPLLADDFLLNARRELAEETMRLQKEDEAIRKRKELLESMKLRPFWHYCEVCGKKEYITAQDAYDSGWDYPADMGSFGLLSPRTCGNCLMQDTLYWKIQISGGLPIVLEGELTDKKRITWERIKGEPESLLNQEFE